VFILIIERKSQMPNESATVIKTKNDTRSLAQEQQQVFTTSELRDLFERVASDRPKSSAAN
jgi:hypothetical protein